MQQLLSISERIIERTPTEFIRSAYSKIRWKNRLIGIIGARGTGKSTLVLQYLKKLGLTPTEAAYFSLDELYFTSNTLVDTADKFYKSGGKILALDEVHKYQNWAQEIKNLYDRYPDLKIIFTGSSIIDLSRQSGDLSRRAIIYELPGMSYREYLKFSKLWDFEALDFTEILEKPEQIRKQFPQDFRPLAHFPDYLNHGYYPFYKEDPPTYHQRIRQLIRLIIESDMAEIKGFDIRNARKMLQLTQIISQQVPFKPNLSKLSAKANIHRNSINNYLYYLEEARLISLLYPGGSSIARLQKPEKIYLDNTNLMFALAEGEISAGTLRESFFHNQIEQNHKINLHPTADFIVDNKYVFEIGGKNKGNAQLPDQDNAYVVKDQMEYPVGNHLPLWIFGFLY